MASANKIIKLENAIEASDYPKRINDVVHETLTNLSKFQLNEILSNNTNRKIVSLKGKFEGSSGDAIVILEKTAFSEDILTEGNKYFNEENHLKNIFHNDIYGDYQYFPQIELNALKATIIHPASQKHIDKYSVHNLYMVDETPKIYTEVILPQISKDQFDLQWVFNILNHTSESERIVFEDPDAESGFILLPDLKWGGEVDTLYLLAICHKKGIKSLRDLNEQHLPLLKNINKKGIETISSKYGLDGSQLRVYLHYQPSFYHLHIHFTYLRHEAPGILAERAHLLSNVISNIELIPDYYQRVTLPFVVRENDGLFQALEEGKVLKKISKPV
ncbi:hypothetical protein HHI36_019911 [Cryptolaemus montrouzieri]|uniref:m7GpppX diphosphatase n=1 Tax=Cryptolaemus montrouzieri TaxID=559131 RepID=A0ABD2N9G7_9CUCU